jgi:hypothetical protein
VIKPEFRNILEILKIQCPKGSVMADRASRNADIDFAPVGPPQFPKYSGAHGGLDGSERDCKIGWK